MFILFFPILIRSLLINCFGHVDCSLVLLCLCIFLMKFILSHVLLAEPLLSSLCLGFSKYTLWPWMATMCACLKRPYFSMSLKNSFDRLVVFFNLQNLKSIIPCFPDVQGFCWEVCYSDVSICDLTLLLLLMFFCTVYTEEVLWSRRLGVLNASCLWILSVASKKILL